MPEQPKETQTTTEHYIDRLFIGIEEQQKLRDEVIKGGKCPGCEQGKITRIIPDPSCEKDSETENKKIQITIPCPLFKLNGENCEYGREVQRVVQEAMYKYLEEKGVPRRHFKDNSEIDTKQPSYKATKNWDGWGNLTLCGNVGTGKSFAAVSALRRWVGLRINREIDVDTNIPTIQHKVRYTVLPYIEWKRAFEICDDRDTRTRVKKAAILVIDELGAESLNEYSTAILNDVISHRYDNLDYAATIITTNLTPEALAERYGPRMMDRLSGEEGKIIVVDGKNMRFER